MDKKLALGLYVYLNSTLLDKYYRLFGGHTQVNATDLHNMRYPCIDTLRRIGAKVKNIQLTQKEIDDLINEEIIRMTGNNNSDPLRIQEKIDQALEIIRLLGMPKHNKMNERR